MPHRPLRALLALVLLGVATASQALVFAVNEGVTYRVTNDEIRAKYAALAADLGKLLRQPVTVEPIGDYPTLRKGLETREYDLAFIHPAHLSVLAIRDSGYRLLAVTKGYQNYTANFLVRADSPFKTLADLKGTSVGAPDEDSITSWMVRATLRDALGDPKQVSLVYTRYQDAVPFYVQNGFVAYGATASSGVIKTWKDGGGKVCAESRAVPIKQWLASSKLDAATASAAREALLGLAQSDAGKRALATSTYTGFVAPSAEVETALMSWLGI